MASNQAREEFSRRLRKALQDKGFGIDSPTRLAEIITALAAKDRRR